MSLLSDDEDLLSRESNLPDLSIDPIELLLDGLHEDTIKYNVLNDPLVADVRKWRNFRKNNKTALQAMHTKWNPARGYRADPLPKRMSKAYADFMFNSAPIYTPADEADRGLQKDLIRESDFNSKLRTAADICVSEREVWWRVYTDPFQSFWPIIEWHSRMDVRPYMYGNRVLAVAFVTNYGQLKANGPFYNFLEIHARGRVVNKLYRSGGEDQLGQEVNLQEHPLTENIQDEWVHDLPMLAGRVRNGEDTVSIYDGVEDLLLDLNEAHTIDAENFRLAGKKRAAIPRKYKDQAGDLDSGEEIFWTDDDWNEMEEQGDIIKVMEYTYDADGSKSRKDDLERIILTRCGLAKQLVDSDANEGLAQTGTALRTRLVPGFASVEGMSEEWQDNIPLVVSLMQRVDALEDTNGGWSRGWVNAVEPPSVVVTPPIPEDPAEEATRHNTLVTANLESVEHAVNEMHQDWSEDQRVLEVKRILANKNGYALDDAGNPIYPTGVPPQPGSPGPGGGALGVGDQQSQPPGGGGAQSPPVSPGSAGAGVGAGI